MLFRKPDRKQEIKDKGVQIRKKFEKNMGYLWMMRRHVWEKGQVVGQIALWPMCLFKITETQGVPVVAQWKQFRPVSVRLQV